MTLTVKIGEAKTHLSELLAKVEAGEEIVIARGNEPIAKLVPLDEFARRRALFEDMIALRDSGQIKPVTVEELIAWKHEGHQY
jgi:prevent-host-death family protein